MMIRRAGKEDASDIAAICNHVIEDTTITFTTQRKTAGDIAGDIAARGPAFLVAQDAGRVIGYASYGAFRSGPGYARTAEHSIALVPEARGQSGGRALMEALQDVAREGGLHAMIGAVSGENTGGVAFHERLGFERVGHLPEVGFKFGRYLDLVLMQKML